jgi:predicted secreted acid phosphatase
MPYPFPRPAVPRSVLSPRLSPHRGHHLARATLAGALLLAAPLGLCAAPAAAPASSAPRLAQPTPIGIATEPPNLAAIKQQIIRYHESGAYERAIEQITQAAQRYIESRLAHVPRPAMVLDLDDTAISNWSWLEGHDFVLEAASFGAWCQQAKAPSLQPVARLFRWARSHNVAVFFVIGRRESSRSCTEAVLEAAGYSGYQQLYFKPNDYHEASVVGFKSRARQAIAAQGYTILANLGDQESDLAGGGAEQTFKLPNPLYLVP